jgi:large subunit ribosomal protein L23
MSPPKLPRNIFFPWQNFILHQSGTYLEPNRVAFRVPVNMTKFDIREYLRKLYGVKVIKVNTYIKLPNQRMCANRNYFKTDAQYKKAIVTCEEVVPDEVKMINSCRNLRLNPALTKGMLDSKITRGNPARPGQSRSNDWKPRHKFAWREPIPMLLRSRVEERPKIVTSVDEKILQTDTSLPHVHFTSDRSVPAGVGPQPFPRPNADLILNSRKGLLSNNGMITGKISLLAKKLSNNLVR